MHFTARYSDGVIATRQAALRPPLAADLSLFDRLRGLFDAVTVRRGRVRYLRVRLDRLTPAPAQRMLFDARDLAAARGGGRSGSGAPAAAAPAIRAGREEPLVAALDRIRGRFGGGAIGFGRGRGGGRGLAAS